MKRRKQQKSKFDGKTSAHFETQGERQTWSDWVITKRTSSLLRLDWMKQHGIKLDTEKLTSTCKLFRKSRVYPRWRKKSWKYSMKKIVKEIELDIQLNPHAKLVQQSGRPISIHLKAAFNKKHRRDGMSRLGTSRNVQWSAEGARKCVYPRFQNLVNLSSLRSRKFRWKN